MLVRAMETYWFQVGTLILKSKYLTYDHHIWSPNGDLLASASDDARVALLDFKTGKKRYTGKTSDGSNFSLLNRETNVLI